MILLVAEPVGPATKRCGWSKKSRGMDIRDRRVGER